MPAGSRVGGQIKRREGADGASYADALTSLGTDLLELRKWDEAESVSRDNVAIRKRRKDDRWKIFDARSLLGAALLGQKRYDEAAPLLRSGYEGLKKRIARMTAEHADRSAAALDRLIRLAEEMGKGGG